MYSNIGSFSRMSNFCGRRYCSWFKVQTKIWILKRFCQLMFTTYHKKINSFLNGRPIRKQDLKIWIYFFVVSTYLLTVVCILVGIMYCLFLHHGWFVQNLGKDFIPTKGQTNSKWFFQADVSPKKRTNKFVFTTCRLVFVCFLEESEDTKKTFRN